MWSEINNALGRSHRKGIAVIRTSQGVLSEGPAIAEEFNSYFSTFTGSTSPVSEVDQAPDIPHVSTCFKFVKVDEDMVTQHLNHLNVRKATGADGIPAKLLRLAAPGIAKSVTMIFNHSLKRRQIPSDWKAAHVERVLLCFSTIA